METVVNRSRFWLRFGVWFWMLTIIYGFFVATGGAYSIGIFAADGQLLSAGNWIGNFIGLFVPIGLNNFPIVLSAGITLLEGHPIAKLLGAGIGMLILIFCLIFMERFLRKLSLNPFAKIFVNLLILLLLTALIDFLTFKEWTSFMILLGYPPLPTNLIS